MRPSSRRWASIPRPASTAAEDPDRQKLRSDTVSLLAGEAQDKDVTAKLAKAATAYLAGDKAALDQSLFDDGFGAYLATGGDAAVSSLFEKAATSDDTLFRDAAIGALGRSDDLATGRWLIDHMADSRLRPSDRLGLLRRMMFEPTTRDAAFDWLLAHYDDFVKDNGIFTASTLPSYASGYCSVDKAAAIESGAASQGGEVSARRAVARSHGRAGS